MPHDECKQEQLWTLVEARKQARSRYDTASPGSAAIEACPVVDGVLVDVLYQALRNPEPCSGTDGTNARMLLQGAIAADRVAEVMSHPARRDFWQLAGRRQILLAAALLLITAAAIAYIVWSERTPACAPANAPVGASLVAITAPRPAIGQETRKIASGAAKRTTPAPTSQQSTLSTDSCQ